MAMQVAFAVAEFRVTRVTSVRNSITNSTGSSTNLLAKCLLTAKSS